MVERYNRHMMKTANKLIPILIIVLLLPQIAFAAWWNPFSWFTRGNTPAVIEEKLDKKEGTDIQSNKEAQVKQGPDVRERIVEKTIIVDNPELQKKINELFQENLSLKTKIASLISELSAYKSSATATTKSDTVYSDLDFKYSFDNNVITLLRSTSREIKIRKAVFNLPPNYSDTFLKELDKTGLSYKIEIAGKPYNLERTNSTTFSYLGSGIPIVGNENITIKVISGSGVVFRMIPDWSLWEIWDYTTGKPVKIE